MNKTIKTLIYSLLAVLAIGIGTLIWLSAPDSIPETPLEPSQTTIPASTEVPATSVPFTIPDSGGNGNTYQQNDGGNGAAGLAVIRWRDDGNAMTADDLLTVS